MTTCRFTILAILLNAAAFAQDSIDFRLDGPHMLEAHRRAANLIAADLNSDGLVDLCAISNDEALLDVWYRLKKADDEEKLWRLEEYTLDRTVLDVVAMDENGDGLTDLVMAVAGSELAVMRQTDKGRLQKAPDVAIRGERLVAGDLTGDGREDLLVVEGKKFSVLEGSDEGLGSEASLVFFAANAPTSDPQVLDLNGDGQNDLMYLTAETREGVAVRIQGEDGGFPVELNLRTGGLRYATAIARSGGSDAVATISAATRQLVVHTLAGSGGNGERWHPSIPSAVAFDPDRWDEETRSTVADVDGDGKMDIVATVPESAVLRILLQTSSGTLKPVDVPSLKDIRQVLAWPANFGKPSPLIILSGDEKVVGVSTHNRNRPDEFLPFPSPVSVEGEPLAIVGVGSEGNSGLELLIAEKGTEGPVTLNRYSSFNPAEAEAGDGMAVWTFEESREEPQAMQAADINRDGLDDVFVFFEYDRPLVLLQSEDGKFEAARNVGLIDGMLDGATPARLGSARLDDREGWNVFVVKSDFVRTFHLDADGSPEIGTQLNAPTGRSRFRSVAAGRFRDDKVDVAVLDGQGPALHVFGRDGSSGVYELLETVELVAADYQGLHALDLEGDGRDDLVAVAPDRAIIVRGSQSGETLESVVTHRTDIEDGGYGALHRIDLIGDSAEELIALEMKENRLEFMSVDDVSGNGTELNLFYHFRVFDSESSIARRVNLDAPPEPREIYAADLNGDGRKDIAALVHDFVIVYHQR